MFNPSQQDVRRFFCDTYRKHLAQEILTPLETIAQDWIIQHPEYFDALFDIDTALNADYTTENGQHNPFLHLSMHLSITEQVSIDQPIGIRHAFTTLTHKLSSTHEAQHHLMECLGHMIWSAQRNGTPPSEQIYLECIQRAIR